MHYGTNNIYKKIYSHESKGVPVQNLWDDVYFISRSESNKRKYQHKNHLNCWRELLDLHAQKMDGFLMLGHYTMTIIRDKDCDVNPQSINLITEAIKLNPLMSAMS